jgi:hypothetical protein
MRPPDTRLCERFRCRVFASAVDREAPRSGSDILRKDYAYLFDPLGQIVARLRYRAVREVNENPDFAIWSIAVIDDLRARVEHGPRTSVSPGA